MASNYEMTYPVDLVFCIDCTASMQHTLDIVKDNALNFYDDLMAEMKGTGKKVGQLRIRIVAFRDYLEYMKDGEPPMLATDFFSLPQDTEKYAACVRGLQPLGGGDEDEDGLEALAFAMRSPWTAQGAKARHIIALWTDSAPHELGFGRACPEYPESMAKDMAELTSWWGDGQQDPGYMPNKGARRLLLYAPDQGGWKFISDNWSKVIHYTAALGEGVGEADYQEILSALVQSV